MKVGDYYECDGDIIRITESPGVEELWFRGEIVESEAALPGEGVDILIERARKLTLKEKAQYISEELAQLVALSEYF